MFKFPFQLPGIGTLRSWSDIWETGIALIVTGIQLAWFFYFAWISLFWLAENSILFETLFAFIDAVARLPMFPYLPVQLVLLSVLSILGVIWGAIPFLIALGIHKFIERRKQI